MSLDTLIGTERRQSARPNVKKETEPRLSSNARWAKSVEARHLAPDKEIGLLCKLVELKLSHLRLESTRDIHYYPRLLFKLKPLDERWYSMAESYGLKQW